VLLQVPVSITYLVAKVAVSELGVLFTTAVRVLLAGLLVTALLRLQGPLALPRREDRLTFLGLGLLAVPFNQGLFLLAMKYAPASHGALFYASTPIVVLALSVPLLGERLSVARVSGVILGFAGVAVVLLGQGLKLSTSALLGDLALLAGVLAWAGYTLLSKRVLERYPPLYVTGASLVVGAALMIPVALPFVVLDPPSAPSLQGILSLAYLVVFTSVLGYLGYLWALERLAATQTAIVGNLQPLLTAGLTFVVWHEPISPWFLLGTALVIVGVIRVQRG
jgi:drug/metabolite transporter (DMT)-like permease